MCFKRLKKNFIEREDVVTSICELEKEESVLEQEVQSITNNIKILYDNGKKEQDRMQKIFLAKKINYLKEDKNRKSKRALFLLYNLKLLNRLKDAIDDDLLITKVKGLYLSDMLSDQKELAIFLNKVLDTKTKTEDILTDSDSLFNDLEEKYAENEEIYGIESNSNDDMLLSMFELENINELDNELNNIKQQDAIEDKGVV